MPAASPVQGAAPAVEKCPPLFRWAGGKRRLLSQIVPLLPKSYNRYYEPFCGGAAMFFSLRPVDAILSDKNEELINCYRQVKTDPEQVILALQKLANTESEYYEIREAIPKSLPARAARLIYLMALSFNGIYRVNSEGKFNVPYGSKRKKTFDFDRIRNVSKLSQLRNYCALILKLLSPARRRVIWCTLTLLTLWRMEIMDLFNTTKRFFHGKIKKACSACHKPRRTRMSCRDQQCRSSFCYKLYPHFAMQRVPGIPALVV